MVFEQGEMRAVWGTFGSESGGDSLQLSQVGCNLYGYVLKEEDVGMQDVWISWEACIRVFEEGGVEDALTVDCNRIAQ